MKTVKSYAAKDAKGALIPFEFEARKMNDNDVVIDILYCGVCHSDIHQARNEWGNAVYPMVPGHEIIGKVKAVGSEVKNFKVGDFAGIGCLVDSCGACHTCKNDEEQFCAEGIFSYNSPDKNTGGRTFGGYAKQIIAREEFVLRIGSNLAKSPERAAPLLCAGITTYSPLKQWGVKSGSKVAVLGLGGLGHMAIKFAVSFGAEVTVLSTSPSKEEDAKKLGAQKFAITTNSKTVQSLSGAFDIIINTVSADIDYNIYMGMLNIGGVMVLCGIQENPSKLNAMGLVFGRKIIAGTLIGGIKETQEMLDYCDKNNVLSDVEVIKMSDINSSYERMMKSDVKYRFVIDIEKTL